MLNHDLSDEARLVLLTIFRARISTVDGPRGELIVNSRTVKPMYEGDETQAIRRGLEELLARELVEFDEEMRYVLTSRGHTAINGLLVSERDCHES